MRRLVFGVLVSAAFLGGAELLLRLFVPRDALLFSWEKSDAVLEARSGTSPRDVRLLPKPNSSRSDQDGPHVWRTQINAQGFRGSTATLPAAPDRYRVLAVGDSWVYGISTSQGHTFTERLEAALGEVDGRRAEVINAGVPSFSAFDMLVRYHDAMAWLKVDALLVGSPHNEGIQSARADLRKRWYAGIEAGPQMDVFLYLGLRRIVARARNPRYAPGLDATAANAAFADLRALTEDGQKRGLAVVFVAWGGRWENGGVRHGGLSQWQALGATVAAVGLSQRSCFGFSDEAHPSEAGAQSAAAHVAAVLRAGKSDSAWVSSPNCDENDAVGPGKAPSVP